MELDGYTAERDNDFTTGEQYWIYKEGKLVGWLCFFYGILRIAFCSSKDEKLGSPFLFHELYGDECVNEFASSRERRNAMRMAVNLLKEHYGDQTASMRAVAALFPGAKIESKEQLTMF